MDKKKDLPSIFLWMGLCVIFCVDLCACQRFAPEPPEVSGRESIFQELSQESMDFLEAYHHFCEQENASQIALIYLDEDNVPELLIRREREYELYFWDGSLVVPISMPDGEIRANTSGPGYDFWYQKKVPYWFEYAPRQGLVRVHGGDEEGRADFYLRYADGALSEELEVYCDGFWNTYEGDREIANEEFRDRLTELGYDGLIPCGYLYDGVAAAYENMDAESDSSKLLEDFVNGKVEALCYGSHGMGTPTEEEFYLRNYEEIYEYFTCGEPWWGSLFYVDFDNDGEDELMLTGYTNSHMFFDVIGDTVYEVLVTGSTTDNGYVAEMNGRRVIERTDLLHSGRQLYRVQEYDACGCVIDEFRLTAYFEGDRYAEGDEFEYRGRAITMEEFEEIKRSIQDI